MSIGATLAAARRRSGLTLSEVSDRAGVREPIIRGIEQDDYAACGGDSIARSHIRAIAGAVGEDPVPLMDEFDATWRSEDDGPAADGSAGATAAGATAAVVTAAVEAFPPARPPRTRERRRVRWTAFLAVLVVAVLGFASYELATGVGKAHHAAASTHPRPSRPASQPATVPAVTPSAQATSAQPSPPVTPSVTPAAPRTLALAGVAAFGPAGTADGDNPRLASRAIADDPATPWESQWYATAAFGDLKTGTGLLIDLGRTVTVTSVRLSLGGRPGARFQVRVGRTPVLSHLRSVATSAGRGGTVRLRLASPVQARYLLIWFTLLPPDGAGTYQLSVYDITVQGQP